MIMKMHSYMSVNGHLQQVTQQSQAILEELREATEAGGWEKAVRDAKSHRAEMDASTGMSASSSGSTPPSHTPNIPEGSTTSYTDAATANALRQRLVAVSSATPESVITTTPPDEDKQHLFEPHPLIDHPDPRVADLATEYSELQAELTSPGPNYITWPNNISLKNFAVYQLIPSLVYELEYPRTDRYVVEPVPLLILIVSNLAFDQSISLKKQCVFSFHDILMILLGLTKFTDNQVATFGTFALLYTVTETFILPNIPTFEQSIARSLLDLALPFMIAYLLLFYIIFGRPQFQSRQFKKKKKLTIPDRY